jgi:hypothetical protein
MPRTYLATDANGVVHTRSTASRTYSHAVVCRDNYERELGQASHKLHPQQDRRNWEYYVAIVSGRDPHPNRNWRAENPERWSPAEIAEEKVWADAANAKRLADAKAEVGVPDQGLGA